MTLYESLAILVVASGSLQAADGLLACNLKALTPMERQRHHQLAGTLVSALRDRVDLADGYRFRVDPSRASVSQLGEWVDYEHRCCPFFRFRVDVDEIGTVRLTLSGGAGVKQFIDAEFSAAHPLEKPQAAIAQ